MFGTADPVVHDAGQKSGSLVFEAFEPSHVILFLKLDFLV